ncbi:MAG: glycosyl transferase, partial [Anaerolineae bacterium]|nr:glycosyl transferase [Anaerolineae bacterium]
MKYGYFDDDNWEYVVTDPRTPVTWINYIGTLKFGGYVNQTGGMLLCKGDPALNRITKYIPQLPASDLKGSTLYLRLHTEDGYKIFSPFVVPTLDEYESYECRVGLGYTRIVSQFYGVETAVTFFIPTADQIAIQDITITNKTGKDITIDAIPVIEYTHPDALKQFTNADWIPQTMTSELVAEADGRKIIIQYPFMTRDFKLNMLTSSEPVSSFETDRRNFLGRNEFGTWAAPMALQQPELSNTEAIRGDNIGALMIHVGTLAAGAAKRFQVLLGQYASVEAAKPIITKYRQAEAIDAALAERAAFWQDFLLGMQVDTPDKNMNRMLNVYNPRQTYITKNWSRYLSLYQLGLGARGIGFRDSSQDVMGVLTFAPAEGLDLIRQLLHVQKRNGSAMHQYNPLSMVATIGEAGEDERPDYYSDDHLWIVLAVTAYLKETGDFEFLKEEIPFYEKDKNGKPLETGTVFEHLRRALEFTSQDVGQHGLPLAGFADWNDTVNLQKGAESLFTANLYGTALKAMIELVDYLGKTAHPEFVEGAVSDHFQAYYTTMQTQVNQEAWDGDWYVRYFDYDGSPIGSKANTEGKIFTNGQSWPVISGFASPERARTALDSVYEHLNTANGIKLSTPGYDGFDPKKGGVSTYRPG